MCAVHLAFSRFAFRRLLTWLYLPCVVSGAVVISASSTDTW
jgi:hypothetical protein